MHKYAKDLEQVQAKYDREVGDPLETFDSDLRKMKQAFVKNFCQPRV
jgi:hypothetical protein